MAKKSKLFEDLQNAIRNVLDSADDTGCEGCHVVDTQALLVLQAEYNIYFVEQHEKQYEPIT